MIRTMASIEFEYRIELGELQKKRPKERREQQKNITITAFL